MTQIEVRPELEIPPVREPLEIPPENPALDFLTRAWRHIDSRSKWTAGEYSKGRDGHYAYCSIGALEHERSVSKSDKGLSGALAFLASSVPGTSRPFTHHRGAVMRYNDDHSYEKVKEWWQKAMDLAAQTGGKLPRRK